MPGTDAELDRLQDLVERASPQPFVIVEVRITLGAGAATAMAGRAIIAERRLAAGAGVRSRASRPGMLLWSHTTGVLNYSSRAFRSARTHPRRVLIEAQLTLGEG